MSTTAHLTTIAEEFLAAWTSQDVDRVLACYTPDLVYLDPNTRGPVSGQDAMRRYLTRLFARWQMSWRLRELYPLATGAGAAVLWAATLAPAGSDAAVDTIGMDLVLLEDGLIRVNQVYFDRAVLAALG